MNLIELGRNTLPFWWPGAVLFVVLLLYFLVVPQKLAADNRRQLLAQTSVAFLAYSILCLSIVLSRHYFLTASHFVAVALAMLAASSFLVALYFERAKPLMKAAGLMLLVTAASASYGNWLPQFEGGFGPPKEVKLDVYSMTTQQLADEGEKIIFGGLGQSKIQGAIGKGQCPLCHGFNPGFLSERAPNLYGIPKRAQERLKDPRYHLGKPQDRDTVEKEAFPGSGTATTAIEYIAESAACPSCYVVAGFGVKGSNDTENPGEPLLKNPIRLSINDMIAIDTWLYIHSGENPPAPIVIEEAYRKFIPESEWTRVTTRTTDGARQSLQPTTLLATGEESIEDLFGKPQCEVCHTIPGVSDRIRSIGPKLTMKTVAPQRIKDKNYRGKATSVKEYIVESIIDPSIYVVPNYPDNTHPKIFGQKLTALAVQKMTDYLSQLEEGKVPPKIN